MSGEYRHDTAKSTTLQSTSALSADLSSTADARPKERNIVQACNDVCNQLQNTMNEINVLGSVMSLYRAADAVKSALHGLIHYYESISPEMRLHHHHKKHKQVEKEHYESGDHHHDPKDNEPVVDAANVFEQLMKAFKQFEFALKDFHDYVDVKGEERLHKLLGETTMIHLALTEPASASENNVRIFTIEKGKELRPLLEELPSILKRFTTEGIPCIKVSQKRSAVLRTNTATVATFFAGVAASALQFSVEAPDNALQVATNTLWFASLVLSIGSATGALLAMTWQQSVFSSPARDLPWFVTFWTRQGFLVLLVASVITFVAGLLTYVFNTQNAVAFWVTLGCVAFCSIGLSIVVVWVVYEREEFARLRKVMRSEHPFAVGSLLFSRVKYSVHASVAWMVRRKQVSYNVRKDKLKKKDDFNQVYIRTEKVASGGGDRLKEDFYVQKIMQPQFPAVKTFEVSHMSASPKGEWIVICYGRSNQCCLFGMPIPSSSELTCCVELGHGEGVVVAQIAWSPHYDDRRFATRSSDGVRVWSITTEGDGSQVNCQSYLFIHEPVIYTEPTALWIYWSGNESLLVLQSDEKLTSVREFDVYHEVEKRSLELPTIKDMSFSELQCDEKNNLLFFIASRHVQDQRIDFLYVRNMNQEGMINPVQPAEGVRRDTKHRSKHNHKQRNANTDLELYGIITKMPLAHRVQSLEIYPTDPTNRPADPGLIVFSYEHGPPDLWSYSYNASNKTVELARIREFDNPIKLPPDDTYWDDAFLAGPRREELVSSANDMVFFWDRFNGDLLRVKRFVECPPNEDPEIAWSSAADISMVILGAWGDGKMAICTNRWAGNTTGDPTSTSNETKYTPPIQPEGLLLGSA